MLVGIKLGVLVGSKVGVSVGTAVGLVVARQLEPTEEAVDVPIDIRYTV
jgi:hypothetical protein